MAEPMRRRLKDAWGISASVVPQAELGNVSQLYDPDRRLFLMSSQLRAENRTFALAYQLALVEFAGGASSGWSPRRRRPTRASASCST